MEKLGTIAIDNEILKNASIGLWAFEIDEGKPPRMYVDDNMLKLIGLTKQISPEETYHAWYDYVDDNHYGMIEKAVEKMSAGSYTEVQYPWHHPNGEVWMVRCGGNRNFAYKDGIRIEGTHQDVTSITHLQKNSVANVALGLLDDYTRNSIINRLADRYEDVYLVDVPSKSVQSIRVAGGAVGVSNAIKKSLPYEETMEIYIKNNVVDEDKDAMRKATELSVICGKLRKTEHYFYHYRAIVFGEEHYYYMEAVRLDNEEDSSQIVFGFACEDEEKEKERMLKDAIDKAQSSSRAKSTFLFNMSHDIRTPMNGIIGYTDRLEKHIDDKAIVQDSVTKIKIASDFLLHLINDVLDMARIESDKFILEERLWNVKERANQICEIFGEDMNKRNITFIRDFEEITDPLCWYDGLRARQIINNIISNAVKYSLDGGTVTYKIKQAQSPKEGYARFIFTITDTGIGMSEEYLSHIYEEFSRSESSTISGIQGTGLGMSIVKKITDALDGTIDVVSSPNGGTTVTVVLDFRKSTKEEQNVYILQNATDDTEIKLDGLKILLVEDNEMNREIGTEILEDLGCTVLTAEDGSEAVKMVNAMNSDDIDVILMDVQMPVMNGYEATRRIRALNDASKANKPIIAMTANAFEEDKKASLEAGMNDHLTKPINMKELIIALKNIYNGR